VKSEEFKKVREVQGLEESEGSPRSSESPWSTPSSRSSVVREIHAKSEEAKSEELIQLCYRFSPHFYKNPHISSNFFLIFPFIASFCFMAVYNLNVSSFKSREIDINQYSPYFAVASCCELGG
jgi:hypothetical protein